MPECHTWAGVAHNLFNPLSHFGRIAVYSTFVAGWFFVVEGTGIQAVVSIIPYNETVST